MLYLEDYMEMIENLPMEMRDRFTEMREMDLQVQNAMDSLDDRLKSFFKSCASNPSLTQDWKDTQFENIKQEYGKALEDADEKVQLANQIYELLERYLRKLDQEVLKFKMELEADHAGITEMLEKRSLDLDNPQRNQVNNHRAEKRKYTSSSMSNHVEKRQTTEKSISLNKEISSREALSAHRNTTSATSSPAVSMFNSSGSTTPAISYSLGHVGAGSNAAIQAAASKAIGATLEMHQGRRTSSLKASYDALTKADLAKEAAVDSTNQTTVGGADTPTPVPTPTTSTSGRSSSARNKKATKAQLAAAAAAAAAVAATSATSSTDTTTTATVTATDDQSSSSWQYDPNEPRYCVCNDVSYGEMVGCDNGDCPIEWFHYGCVGLTHAPKGKWFCPQCTAAMKRRGRK